MIENSNIVTDDEVDPLAIQRLSRDLRNAAKTMGPHQARYLVDHYYSIQEYRKAAANQVRSLGESSEPVEILGWLFEQSDNLETYIKSALDVFAHNHPVGQWMLSVKGIGPVITAGLLAHIDIEKAPTVGHIWRFAGLDSTVVWNKGERRPWNGKLKVLCWKIGDSFVKWSSGDKPSPYGIRYRAWKDEYVMRNERGDYAELARTTLETRNFRADSDARAHYEAGKLPPGRLELRARRKATKLFLSHAHDFWYRNHYNAEPPVPYVLEHGGHTHYIPRPDQLDPKEWMNYFGRLPCGRIPVFVPKEKKPKDDVAKRVDSIASRHGE